MGLHRRFVEIFERVLDLTHELVGHGAIDDSMVEPEGDVPAGLDTNRVGPIGQCNDLGTLLDSPNTEDGDSRLRDDGRTPLAPENTRVGNGEGDSIDLGRHRDSGR